MRQQQSKPIVEALKPWFEACLAKVSKGGKLGKAIRYGLRHWDGLCRFRDDGRIEIESNCVERSIRGLALTRHYAQVRIMRRCRAACAESPADRPSLIVSSQSSCT